MVYLIHDLETENHSLAGRKGSPFHPDNWIVATGWKKQGSTRTEGWYAQSPEEAKSTYTQPFSDDITLAVGFNYKFDMLYVWEDHGFQAFLKRGGKIWCCQLAEYLLEGQAPHAQMCSLDSIVEKYGGKLKIDEVKALWNDGMLTSQIPRDLLMDYLLGPDRTGGDIGNTELVFLGQIARAHKKGMLKAIQQRMDSLLCTTEMEFNGLQIDMAEGEATAKVLEEEAVQVTAELQSNLPKFEEGFEFNWGSRQHLSAFLFGGTVKFQRWAQHLDDNMQPMYVKKDERWPLFAGVPVDVEPWGKETEHDIYLGADDLWYRDGVVQDTYASGKRKGEGKFKTMKVPDLTKPKGAQKDFGQVFERKVEPLAEWATKNTDFNGNPYYSVSGDVLDSLGNLDGDVAQLMGRHAALVKELGTYYRRYDPKKDTYVGMLCMVNEHDGRIHHSLNHVITVTTRLSSSNPNLQNIPRGDKSRAKAMFVSRFGDAGVMIEADYSQLEVVGQGLLSLDPQLCQDVRDGVDFHCKRVSARFGVTYEEAVYLCKDESAPDHKMWKARRTECKIFSFQRAYGAGASKIALTTGIAKEAVEEMIEAEDRLYPGVVSFNDEVKRQVESTPNWRMFDPELNRTVALGAYKAFTGTGYRFRQWDSPDYLKKKGIESSFSPTEMKNYPVQGTSGELVQLVLGKLYRRFRQTDNYGGKAFLVNTVHDCIWVDCHNSVLLQVAADIKRIMEAIPLFVERIFKYECPVPFPVEVEFGKNMLDLHHAKEFLAGYSLPAQTYFPKLDLLALAA